MTSPNGAFSFLPLDPRRSLEKPRRTGLTMVSDYQLGLAALEDLLKTVGDAIDIFKLATGTARLLPRAHLIRKTALLRRYGVRVMLGGQFLEYVRRRHGPALLPAVLQEARELGVEIVEVSENVVPLAEAEEIALYEAIRQAGLTAVGEVGDKREHSDPAEIVADVHRVLALGGVFALVEGQELVVDGAPNQPLIDALREGVDPGTCVFELATPRVGATAPQIYAGAKALIRAFGPDVNLGNVTPDKVMEIETTRLGLGSAGPDGAAR